MAKSMSLHILLVLIFLILFFSSSLAIPVVTYNVISLGAKSDGRSDSTKAFLAAWAKACGSTAASTIYVPPGRYLLHNVVFQGQCRNNDITIRIDGTLVAPSDYRVIGDAANWILFEHVNGVYIYGGILDGQGARLWACKRSGNNNCYYCEFVAALAKSCMRAGVQNVTVKTVTFTGTENGLRIKSWGRPSTGFARNILFQHALMKNVDNPIVIDQNYCPDNKNCPGKSSGVKISDVTYQDIHGASATEIAVKFDCSPKYPCSGINLEDVKLIYKNQPAEASCRNTD
ncbi:hypothetical protein CUMW_260360 [Citrus unshiu]|uniref:Pectate lyase superfamily protein domain-containing protein n=1 Tax=Citrus unshiu TaxID=55188 RepID=A0A2H5QUH6_CITUN|nr:hypothetical protein CUMW_260360 [Citrus unshiu]